MELVREYISYLQVVPKYQGHPFHTANGDRMSAANVRNHVRVLRAFASWLYREDYTVENVLTRLKAPTAPKKVLETLSEEEIKRLFASLGHNTVAGCRDAAMLLLFLDTGLRCAELIGLATDDVHIQDQWLKVMGKVQKERIVPFGNRAAKNVVQDFEDFPGYQREVKFLKAYVNGHSVAGISRSLGLCREHVARSIQPRAIRLVAKVFLARANDNGGLSPGPIQGDDVPLRP